MSLKTGKINPLNALNLRKVSFPAHHFYYLTVSKYNPMLMSQIDQWIYFNLNSRYYIGQSIDLINNTLLFVIKIGFEKEKESSFFRLSYPHFV